MINSNPLQKTNETNKPIVLTIGGSDSAGMAGIQMDIKVQSAFDVHSFFAITANTAQNNQRVLSINPVDATVLKQQLDAISAYPIEAVKVGLISTIEQVKVIADFISQYQLPLILDPVLASTSDFDFFDNQNLVQLTQILLPLADLVTPNIIEASLLSGLPLTNPAEMEQAAFKLKVLGAKNVLLKGGHLMASEPQKLAQDYYLGKKQAFWLSSEKKITKNSRGTGCALASSIASCVALGYPLDDAVVIGKMAINQGLRNGYSVAGSKGPVLIQHFPNQSIDLPKLSHSVNLDFSQTSFAKCNSPKLGLYPVVDRARWIERLLKIGITTIQLRIKDLHNEALEVEIKQAIDLVKGSQCRLFINDHWQLAVKHNAYGVHLGQEDIDSADLHAINQAGLRLGISSHCFYEVARAVQYQPSYVAFGPVFHTNSKKMPWIPGGIEGLSYWRKLIDTPLVAIGGINQKNIEQVINCGVDGVAMISAITEATNPEQTIKELLSAF